MFSYVIEMRVNVKYQICMNVLFLIWLKAKSLPELFYSFYAKQASYQCNSTDRKISVIHQNHCNFQTFDAIWISIEIINALNLCKIVIFLLEVPSLMFRRCAVKAGEEKGSALPGLPKH